MSEDYRAPGKVRSQALEVLAAAGRQTALVAPAQTSLLEPTRVTKRLELATDVHGDRAGCATVIGIIVGLFALNIALIALKTGAAGAAVGIALVIAVASVIAPVWLSSAAARRRRLAVEAELAWPATLPFAVTGYRDWLVADRSILVIELSAPIARATLADAAKAMDPAIEVTPVGERSFELVVPSRVLSGESPERFGDVPTLKRLVAGLMGPLHHEIGIERVSMGGTILDR